MESVLRCFSPVTDHQSPVINAGGNHMDQRMLDTLAIKEVVENWAVSRDSGDWERFRTAWHEEGVMMATWFQGPFEEFIRVNQEGWSKGVSILHFLGGTSVEVAGTRAIAQTKMTISQRAPVHNVLVDVLCTGRFYDFFEKRNDRWGIVLRRLFYEKDRMDPVDPSKTVQLDPKILAQFPEGYRHLAYLQSGLGYKVKVDMPGLRGPDADALYALGKKWLSGGAL
jgi:SnoaL-like domain